MENHAKQQAAAQFAHIAAMMEAQRMDWDRLEELREMMVSEDPMTDDETNEMEELDAIAGEWADLEEVQRAIDEHPLSIDYRSGWSCSASELVAEEFCILLCTGGPAVRIVGEIGEHGQPVRAWLEYQDWGTPWTQYLDADQDVLVDYATAFIFA